jgi:hypothetical protein
MLRMNLIVKDWVELMTRILFIKNTTDVMITAGIVVKDIGRQDSG